MLSRILRALGGLALAAAIASPALAAGGVDFVSPRAGATLTGGSVAEVRWRAVDDATREGGLDEAELVLSLDGGRTFPLRVSAELTPGASSYRWQVPSFATRSARLALRVGAGHERGRERLVRVSDEFAISAAAPEPQALQSGAEETWTEQALFERTAGDLLGGTLRGGGRILVSPASEHAAVNPDPAPVLPAPAARAAVLATSRAARPRIEAGSFRPAPESVPLRL